MILNISYFVSCIKQNIKIHYIYITRSMTDNKKKDENIIIVENGINTCYISSLLMALFYSPSNIYYKMLESDPNNPNFYYLQELIKINFIEPIRKGYNVTADTINEIRNYMFINGWKLDNPDELFEQQDVNELYLYLSNNLYENQIDLVKQTTNEMSDNFVQAKNEEKVPFINLSLTKDFKEQKQLSIEDLLYDWMNDNIIETKQEINKNGTSLIETVKSLASFKISNIPYIFPIAINRFNGGKKNNTAVDVKYQIKPLKGLGTFDNARWSIHSIICHTGKDTKNGHYYTVMLHGNKWFIFDDQSVPSLYPVDMKLDILKNKVMSEVVFAIYKYDELSI